ncbi:hypothetical protein [Roseobacter sp.]|uniref:hypothetical protein n=1 Tax=Roseobacter sp. TaxID=1907202 RepID=UPI00385A3AFD
MKFFSTCAASAVFLACAAASQAGVVTLDEFGFELQNGGALGRATGKASKLVQICQLISAVRPLM